MMQEKVSEPQQIWWVVKRETLSPTQNLVVWPLAIHYANCAILIVLVIQFWLDCFSLHSPDTQPILLINWNK